MGFIFRLIKCIIRFIIYLALFFAIVVLIPNLPPYTNFTSIEIEPTQARVGPLAPNELLNNAEKLYKGKLLGPEAFQILDGEVYTSLATGEIVKISPGGHVTFVTKIGKPCSGLPQEQICGRSLGFDIDAKNKLLYIADAYYGIWKVDLKTDKKQALVTPQQKIEGRQAKLFNHVAIAKNGDLYWTDSSSDFHLKDGAYTMLTDPSGRLFHYNSAKGESKVLLDNLWFANGLAISPDNQFVVVAETFGYRLMKYYINGPKKGQSEVFSAGLPGTPDNVRALPDGSGVLVGLFTVFDEQHPLLAQSMAKTPVVRKFLARLQRLIEIPFEFMNNMYPHFLLEDIVYHIGHFKSLAGLMTGMAGLVQIDWNGNIVASYYNTDGSLAHISDAIVYNDKLYFGNPHKQDFIGAVPAPSLLKKAFASIKTAPPPKTAENVVKEIPKTKTETKPEQQKPVESKPKQNVQEKSKVEEKKEAPKTMKPVTQQPPKAAPNTKPAESAKPASKPNEKKPTVEAASATKPTAQPKVESKSTTHPKPDAKPQTKQTEPVKPTASKQDAKPVTPKQEPKTPKSTEAKPTPQQKPASQPKAQSADPKSKQPGTEKKQQRPNSSKSTGDKPAPEHIPIKEEIPSDTAKPSKETLKVIKKDGPAEIPNPSK